MADISRQGLYSEIGRRIRLARESQQPKLNQGQLAERLGVERTSITNIESGAQRATVHLLFLIAQKLEISLESLLPAVDDPAILEIETVPETISVRLGEKTQVVPVQVKSFYEKA